MVNEIVEGVAAAIRAKIPDARVWQMDIAQGLETPCFFIAALSPSVERRPGGGTWWRVPLDVHYFPQADGDNGELMGMADTLSLALEAIPFAGGKLRGTSRHFETEDGVLHFMVTYEASMAVTGGIPMMETLAIDQGTTER